MINKRLITSVLTIGILAAAFVWYWSGRKQQEIADQQRVYKKLDLLETDGAFDFSATTIDKKPFVFHDLQAGIVLLNFWASWCAPCVVEYPSMLRLVASYGGKIKMVTVSLDDKIEDLERFLKRFGRGTSDVIHIWDEDKSIAKKFGTEKLPETYIFNSDLKLVRKVPNSEDWERDEVKAYLNQFID